MSIYTRMAAVSDRLLSPDKFGQGFIQLMREVPGTPGQLWEPPAPSSWVATTLKGAVRGVGKELIGAPVANGGQIVASDLVVLVAPWGGTVEPTDRLEIDGEGHVILAVTDIPEAGTVSAIRLIVRA